jgi:hypothetical protein
MTATFQTAIFNDEENAREALEAVRDGPVCPHCGATGDDVTRLEGNPSLLVMARIAEALSVPLTKLLSE